MDETAPAYQAMLAQPDYNATCALRYPIRRNESLVAVETHNFNALLFWFYVIYVGSTTAFYAYEQQFSALLQKRPLVLLLMSVVGGSMMVTQSVFRNYWFLYSFPCDVLMWIRILMNPLILMPFAVRIVMFNNNLEWARLQEKLTVQRLNAYLGVAPADDGVTKPAKLRKSMYHGVVRAGQSSGNLNVNVNSNNSSNNNEQVYVNPAIRASSGAANGGTDEEKGASPSPTATHRSLGNKSKNSAAAAAAMDGANPASPSTNKSSLPGDGEGSSQQNSSTASPFALQGLWFRSSYAFLVLLTVALLTPDILLCIIFQFTKPFYGRGCVACGLMPLDEILAGMAYNGLVGALFVYYVFKVRGEKDPLGIRKEILLAVVVGFSLGMIAVIGYIIDPWVQNAGNIAEFWWDWFIVFAALVFHTVTCPLQIYYAIRTRRHVPDVTFKDFVAILDDPTAMQLFSAHCVSEFCVESVKFYQQVRTFRSVYNAATPEQRARLAGEIYTYFVQPGSVWEVNISSDHRREIDHIFDGVENPIAVDPNRIHIEMFDRARDEIVDLLRRDSYPRWCKTDTYKAWAASSLTSMPDGSVRVLPSSRVPGGPGGGASPTKSSATVVAVTSSVP